MLSSLLQQLHGDVYRRHEQLGMSAWNSGGGGQTPCRLLPWREAGGGGSRAAVPLPALIRLQQCFSLTTNQSPTTSQQTSHQQLAGGTFLSEQTGTGQPWPCRALTTCLACLPRRLVLRHGPKRRARAWKGVTSMAAGRRAVHDGTAPSTAPELACCVRARHPDGPLFAWLSLHHWIGICILVGPAWFGNGPAGGTFGRVRVWPGTKRLVVYEKGKNQKACSMQHMFTAKIHFFQLPIGFRSLHLIYFFHY
jgi:hypothetical protein